MGGEGWSPPAEHLWGLEPASQHTQAPGTTFITPSTGKSKEPGHGRLPGYFTF